MSDPVDHNEDSPLSVTDLVNLANEALRDLPSLCVEGEISSFRGAHRNKGHLYFDLKDETSKISVAMWGFQAKRLTFEPEDGMVVHARGYLNLHESGNLKFIVTSMELTGEGALRQRVAQLAAQLQAEGLFDASRKRKIPAFCTRICVVTSASGSVFGDVRKTIERRNKLVHIQFVSAAVQGSQAPEDLIRALKRAELARPDAILLVRGGGSYEDLMCFNDERLVRCIADLTVPVVSGIGHEPDTTIADMVADRRSSTPTAAAESIAPSIAEIADKLIGREGRLQAAMRLYFDQDTAQALLQHRLSQTITRYVQSLKTDHDLLTRLTRESMRDIVRKRMAHYDRLYTAHSLLHPRTQLARSSQQLAFLQAQCLQAYKQHIREAVREYLGHVTHRTFSRPQILLDEHRKQLQSFEYLLRTHAEGMTVEHTLVADTLAAQLVDRMQRNLQSRKVYLTHLETSLEQLSPRAIFKRGFAQVLTDAHTLTSSREVQVGDEITIRLAHGQLTAEVTKQLHDTV